jgi:dolichol-phosphate mannosyltransferase
VILIPTYNEAANVGPLHDLIRSRCGFDMLFIDDGSPDGTADAVRELAALDPGVHLLARGAKEGLGNAYRAAYRQLIEEGRWERVFMMDADLSHQPRHLAALDAALNDSDMVIGSRYLRGVSVLNWSIVRLNLSYAANRYIRTMTGMPFTDCTSGFRAFRAEIAPILLESSIRAGGYAFLVETLNGVWVRDLRITEVPIVFVERERGSSKVSPQVFMESLMTPVRLLLRRVFLPRQ